MSVDRRPGFKATHFRRGTSFSAHALFAQPTSGVAARPFHRHPVLYACNARETQNRVSSPTNPVLLRLRFQAVMKVISSQPFIFYALLLLPLKVKEVIAAVKTAPFPVENEGGAGKSKSPQVFRRPETNRPSIYRLHGVLLP